MVVAQLCVVQRKANQQPIKPVVADVQSFSCL